MSLPRFFSMVALGAVVAALLGPAPAPAGAASELLVAPFSCGTEWRGTSYGGHGSNDWNLDINRTSRTYAPEDFNHDLGQPILAQGHGTVVWVAQDGDNKGAGAYLEVDYGDFTVIYVHLVEHSIEVEVGDIVVVGELLALLGGTGNASHPHLHLEYWDSAGAEYDDARRYLLPAENHRPIEFDGVTITASSGAPSPAFVSSNCSGYPFADVAVGSFARDDIALLYELGVTTGTGLASYSPEAEVNREQMAAFLARLWRLLDDGATELPDEIPMPFDDVDPGSYARDDIALLAHLEVTTGTESGTYGPSATVTREQMAAFLARLWRLLDGGAGELPQPLDDPFVDVADASFAHDDILTLSFLGVTTGVTDERFAPDVDVNREQMAAFLARLYRLFAPAPA